MKKRITPLFVLIVPLLLPPGILAKEKAKDLPPITEQTIKLDTLEVKTNPFANWGIGIFGRLSLWNKMSGGPPKVMYVSSLASHSPADLAGVQIGDEIKAINGIATPELRWSDLEKLFYSTDLGDLVVLELFDHVTKQRRTAELKIKSNRSWERKDGILELNCWSLRVRLIAPTQVHGTFYASLKRVVRYIPVQVIDPKLPKKRQVKVKNIPVYTTRRGQVFTCGGKSLTFIEREDHVVEIIDTAKVPESDDVVGRLLPEGSTLTLKADGTYEIQEAPPKASATPASVLVSDAPASNPPIATSKDHAVTAQPVSESAPETVPQAATSSASP